MNLSETLKTTCVLSMPTNAHRVDNIITSSHPLIHESVFREFGIELTNIEAEKSIFGFSIPYIPVQIDSIELLSDSNKEKFTEILTLHTRLVQSLSKWIGTGFSLRYIFDPHSKSVNIALLGRVVTQPGKSHYAAVEIAKDVEGSLSTLLNLPVQRISSGNELEHLLLPFDNLHFSEIWQHEQPMTVVERTNIGEEINYPVNVICPFSKPSNATWLNVFKRISLEPEPVVVNIHIEPTLLYYFEEYKLQEAIKTISGYVNYEIIRNTYKRTVEDPINKAIASSFARRWAQLSGSNAPILEVIQVGSTNPVIAFEIAEMLAPEITNSIHFEDTIDDNALIPCGYDIVSFNIGEDRNIALSTLTKLDIFPRKFTNYEYRGRSRYLSDVHSASAAFRFPIPLKTGIPGIATPTLLEGVNVEPNSHASVTTSVSLGHFLPAGNKPVGIPLDNFPGHILVAGTVGTGKTFTCLQILSQLWKNNIPWLVIEPVKAHYRTLIRDTKSSLSTELQVFTLGNEDISPFRLNPFELIPGIRVEEHISQLEKCFEAALPQFPALPMIIQDSLYNIYFSRDWQLSDSLQPDDKRSFPTLGDFYIECISVAQNGGWSAEVTQNIVGAASVRIGGLLRGSKGLMLNTSRSIPIEKIMEKPTVLELMSFNNNEKALIMMFLLVFIREYAQKRKKKGKLSHVTLIEEAHRVMSANSASHDIEVKPDIGGGIIRELSEDISEVRHLGEGIIIAEQIPSRLIEDAHKNTKTKIIHNLPGEDDRRLVCSTIKANSKQVDDISTLDTGQAAFFTTGMQGTAFIKVHNYPGENEIPDDLSDEDVKHHMNSLQEAFVKDLFPFQGCSLCEMKCLYRERVMLKAYHQGAIKEFKKMNDYHATLGLAEAKWFDTIRDIQKVLLPLRLDKDFNAIYCFITHLADFEITASDRDKLQWKFNLLSRGG